MPLPSPPTRKPNNAANRLADAKADNDLLIKGILCVVIGAAVLLAPHFLSNPGTRDTLAQAAPVGWFATVLGCAFVGLYLRRRAVASKRP